MEQLNFTRFVQVTRNSDPRVFCPLFTDIILISTPYQPCKQKGAMSNTGPIWVFSWIHPFGSVDLSSRGNVFSRDVIGSANCKNSSISFVMKYCPTSTVFEDSCISTNFCQSIWFVEVFPLVLCVSAIDFLVQEFQSRVWVSSSMSLLIQIRMSSSGGVGVFRWNKE